MSGVRARVVLALLSVVVPIALAFALFTQRARRDASLETAYESALARMESGGREQCEERPRRVRRVERRLIATYDASYLSRRRDAPALAPSVVEALSSGEVAVLDPTAPPRAPRAVLRMPWSEGPCAVLLVELPLARPGTLLRDVTIMGVVLALSLLAAFVALGPTIRRLGALADAVKGRSLAVLTVPSSAHGKDEVGVLARALDEAALAASAQLEALTARDRALRGYVDGTTHDLAVPLTVLQSRLAELSADPSVSRETIEGAVSAVSYLGQLTANLATAARLEGGVPLERRQVDVKAVIQRVADRLAPIARHRRVELAVSVPDGDVRLDGDELLLERAFSNLVHNAIHHRGPEPGHVAVIVRAEPLAVTVKGDGARVDLSTLEKLRAGETPSDASRTRGRGLGLSVVRQVAAAHGLSLDFARTEDETLEVTLRGERPDPQRTVSVVTMPRW